jgi:hypothetical protein
MTSSIDLGDFKYEGKRGAGYLVLSAPESKNANATEIIEKRNMAGIFIASSQIHQSMPLRGIAELWGKSRCFREELSRTVHVCDQQHV